MVLPHSLIVEKVVEKWHKQSIIFFSSVIKIILDNFNDKTSLALEACYVTIIEWMVYKKSTIFEILCEYLGKFIIYFFL